MVIQFDCTDRFDCNDRKKSRNVMSKIEMDSKVHPHIVLVFREIFQSFKEAKTDVDTGRIYSSVDTSGWDSYRPEIKKFVESFEQVPNSMIDVAVSRVLSAFRLWLWGVEVRDEEDFCECSPAVPILKIGRVGQISLPNKFLIPVDDRGIPVCFCNKEGQDKEAVFDTYSMKVFPDEFSAIKYISSLGRRFFRFNYDGGE